MDCSTCYAQNACAVLVSLMIQLYLSLESKGPNLYFGCLLKQKVDAFDFVFGRYHTPRCLTVMGMDPHL